MTAENTAPNRLIDETSPYLRQHAYNPVDWYPWGQAAFDKAGSENKPIFLSIGYAACHWCHVMEHESFSTQETAAILNQYFVSIKVDREERPDVDKIYMDSLVAATGQGGWPLSAFLTHEGHPFYIGTYFPPRPRYGMPAFNNLLLNIAQSYRDNTQEIHSHSRSNTGKLSQANRFPAAPIEETDISLTESMHAILKNFDIEHGGWGHKPKFPQALVMQFLLNKHVYGQEKSHQNLTYTLDKMARGGMYDILRGGFHRYSTDKDWLVPHFEKMLYDNALLAQVYLYTGLLQNNRRYLDITEEILRFLQAEMLSAEEGFWSSLDADSEGEEGKFYVWEYEELEKILQTDELSRLTQALEVSQQGNFERKNILRFKEGGGRIAEFEKLKAVQDQRLRPATDDKLLTDWNALAISAFAKAGLLLQNREYTAIAEHVAEFILTELIEENRLYHSYRAGQRGTQGFLSDYAFLANALIDLFLATHDEKWLQAANDLCDQTVDLFWDGVQFFDTGHDAPHLIMRPQTLEDSVLPSGWAVAAQVIQRLNWFRLDEKYSEIIEASLKRLLPQIKNYPFYSPVWLNVIAGIRHPVESVILVKHPADLENGLDFEKTILKGIHPDTVFLSVYEDDPAMETNLLLKGKAAVQDKTTVYLCSGSVCSLPITSMEELQMELGKSLNF